MCLPLSEPRSSQVAAVRQPGCRPSAADSSSGRPPSLQKDQRGESVQPAARLAAAVPRVLVRTGPAAPRVEGSVGPAVVGLPEHAEVRFYEVRGDGLLVERVGGLEGGRGSTDIQDLPINSMTRRMCACIFLTIS